MNSQEAINAGQKTEARKRLRVKHSARVEIHGYNREWLVGRLRDISQAGMYLQVDENRYRLPLKDEALSIRLIMSNGGSSLNIQAMGTMVRSDRKGLAIRFIDPLRWWPIFIFFPMNRAENKLTIYPQGAPPEHLSHQAQGNA